MRALSALFAVAAMAVSVVSAQAGNHGTIVDVAKGAGQFNTLLTAAQAAGLVPALRSKGPLTVFAPTDAAFDRLPKGAVAGLLKPENKHKLAAVLKYHVVAGRITSAQIAPGRSHVRTLNGKSLTVRKHGGVRVNSARVIKADVGASNGVIHVIDRVLLPR